MRIGIIIFGIVVAALIEWFWYKTPPTSSLWYRKHRLKIQLIPIVLYTVIRIYLYFGMEKVDAFKYHFVINAIVIVYFFFRFSWLIFRLLRMILRRKNTFFMPYWVFVGALAAFMLWDIVDGEFLKKPILRVYKVETEKINSPISIIHFSDLHLGSFFSTQKVEEMIAIINEKNPDVLCFTGDLVNSSAQEAKAFIPLLKNLAPHSCKVAVLGNHDYGDAYGVRDEDGSFPISEDIDAVLEACGFIVLRDSSFYFSKGSDTIVIAGTNNSGSPPFSTFGDYRKAMSYTANKKNFFTVMLTHDPDYWGQTNAFEGQCDLTLSGHTHGGQMGIRINEKLYLSPAAIRNRYNGGWYQKGKKSLFVSTGMGNIGLNMRLGVRREVVEFVLQ